MKRVSRFRLVLVLLLFAVGVRAAEDPKSPPPPPDRYFSGTVIAQSPENLTVSRTVLGRNEVSRSFAISPQTVIEGEIRERSRVTVQYVTREDVHLATHIIVRNPPPKR